MKKRLIKKWHFLQCTHWNGECIRIRKNGGGWQEPIIEEK